MPMTKDETGRRSVTMETLVHGTPEEVWAAMATGPGNTAWFTKTTIDERVGGEVRFQFGASQGGQESKGEVTEWSPPHRFAYVERDWEQDAPPLATEITVHPHAGGTCVVRMVHSFTASTDTWDEHLDGFEDGWAAFFDVLRLYLREHAGAPAASFFVMQPVADAAAAWKRIAAATGAANADAGDELSLAQLPEASPVVVEKLTLEASRRSVLTRAKTSTIAFGSYVGHGRSQLGVLAFFYGDEAAARAARTEPLWREWLGTLA